MARQQDLTYEAAKTARSDARHADSFATFFNAATFEAALVSKGVAAKPEAGTPKQWEAMGDGSNWSPYDEDVTAQIEAGRARGLSVVEVRSGPRGWRYEIDFDKMVQRNPKTRKERTIRCVEKSAMAARASAKGMSLEDIRVD